jgi:hypothetical protein
VASTRSLRRAVIVGCLLVAAGLLWWIRGSDAPARGAAAPAPAVTPADGTTAPGTARPAEPAEAPRELAPAPVESEGEPDAAAGVAAPAACSVSGTTRFEPGIAGGPVTLALFPLRDGRPERAAADQMTVAAGECYCLRSAVSGRHALVAVARGGSERRSNQLLRPATATLDLVQGAEVELEPLELGWGESIAGRVVRSDGSTPAETDVTARLLEGPRGLTLADIAELSWVGDAFEFAVASWSSADGAFSIRGLAPLRYAITGDEDPPRSDVPRMVIASRDDPVEVTASAEGIVVSTGEPAPVRFRVTGSGRSLSASIEVLRGEEIDMTWSSPDGLLDLVVDPAERHEIVFSHVEHLSRRLVFEPFALVPGSMIDVDLEHGPPAASLVIELSREAAVRLAEHPIDLWVYPQEELRRNPYLAELWLGGSKSGPGAIRSFEAHPVISPGLVRDGPRIIVEALPPGHYLVRVIPRAPGGGAADSMWLEERLELDFAAGERVHRVVDLVLGGRVRFDVRGAPSSVHVRFELEGLSAAAVKRLSDLRVPGVTDYEQPLAPGRWTLYVRSSEATLRTVAFSLVAGETTDVVVDLAGL